MLNTKLLSYNIIPVVAIHVLFLPLWFLQHPFFTYNVSLAETIVNLVGVPLYLVVLNYRYALAKHEHSFWRYILLMLAVVLGSNVLTYVNWAISSGVVVEEGLFLIFEWLIIFNFAIVIIFGLMAQAALSHRKRSRV